MPNKNLIFLTMARMTDISRRGIYSDLLRKFKCEGWNVYVVSPHERSLGLPTRLVDLNDNLNLNDNLDLNLDLNLNGKDRGKVYILGVRTLNLQKTSTIEKGVGQVLVEGQYKAAIKKYLKGVKFDLITYSTPPITFTNVVKYLKKKNPQAVAYLQLKDIFPQNAVDLGMMVASPKPSPQGKGLKNAVMAWPKYLLYKYFRRKEKKLYAVSDFIGCMSPANVEYVLKHNPELNGNVNDNVNDNLNLNDNLDDNLNVNLDLNLNRVEVAPNSVEAPCPPKGENSESEGEKELREKNERYYIRKKYNLPTDRPIFIYGGNLGKPQGIDYLIKCLDAVKGRMDCHFVVVGTGTELPKLKAWYDNVNHNDNLNVTVMKGLPKEDYDMLVKYCDVGLIFLDHRFTIPNYPSRLLSYLENRMPVLCATDPNTDMGRIAEENGYGYWCESVKPEDFVALVDKMLKADRKEMGEKGYQYLCENYTVENTYNAIVSHLQP